MATPNILHMISPGKNTSPFDVNMGADAGFNVIVPYNNIEMGDIEDLVQDAMFSRSPADCKQTGAFVGGNDAIWSLEVLDTARETMFEPFQFSVFADPAGSFTTAGAMVACVEKALKKHNGGDLKDQTVVVFGATGVVGYAAAVICALEGAKTYMVGYDGTERVGKRAAQAKERFGCDIEAADGSSEDKNTAAAREATVIFSAGPAGRQLLSEAQLREASKLKVASDVNAVAPAGIEGIGVHDNCEPIPGTDAVGIGALTVGDIKYKAQSGLFKRMIDEDGPLFLDFRDAYEIAKSHVG